MKEPTSIITVGIALDPETLSSLLREFGTCYSDFSMIKINGRKAKRDFMIVHGGDVITLLKKEK